MELSNEEKINTEATEAEKSAEKFKSKLRFLVNQLDDVVGRLEKDLETNYEDLEKSTGVDALKDRITKNTDIIEFLYKVLKENLISLKKDRLKEINEEYMQVAESSSISPEDKEKSRQDYLHKLEKLVSDEDFNITNQRVMQGNLYNLQSQFKKLQPSERVAGERAKHVMGETQEEAISNIKIIQEGLRANFEKSGDITDYGLYSLSAAFDVIDDLISLYKDKIEKYKNRPEISKVA